MESHELMIGNCVLKDGEKIIVSSYTFYNIEKDPESYDPIPLTEEWLINFGFEKIKSSYKEADIYDFVNRIYFDMANQSLKFNGISFLSIIPEHVHTLQNLYFALTGQQLKLK